MTTHDDSKQQNDTRNFDQINKEEASASSNKDKNTARGFFKIFRKGKDTETKHVRSFSATGGMREVSVSKRVFSGSTMRTIQTIEEYMTFRQALKELQTCYLRFYNQLIRSGHTVDSAYLEIIEDAMDGVNTIVKHELNTILFEKSDAKRLADAVFEVRKELLEFTSLHASLTVDPFTVSFHVPEFFFRSKVAKKLWIPYGTSKNHKQLFEAQFWNEVINHLNQEVYNEALTYFTPIQNKWGIHEDDEILKVPPFCSVLVKVTSNECIDVDQYEVRPLINSLVAYGWLRGDSVHHLQGVFVVNEPPNDDNSGMVEIKLMTNHPFS